jgi:hypothetical protein
MPYTVAMKVRGSGPPEQKCETAREAQSFYAAHRGFGAVVVRDDQDEISESELRRRASAEDAAERQQFHSRNA